MTSDNQAAPGPDPGPEDPAGVPALLDALGRRQREMAAGADGAQPGTAEERLAEALRSGAWPGEAEAGQAPRPDGSIIPHTARRRVLALAASLLLALGAWSTWKMFTDTTAPAGGHDPVLGEALRPLAPLGEAADFSEFRFELPDAGFGATLGADTWAHVVVYDADDDGFHPLLRSPRLRATTWEPPPEDTASWTHVRWRVEIWRGASEPSLVAASDEVHARR